MTDPAAAPAHPVATRPRLERSQLVFAGIISVLVGGFLIGLVATVMPEPGLGSLTADGDRVGESRRESRWERAYQEVDRSRREGTPPDPTVFANLKKSPGGR